MATCAPRMARHAEGVQVRTRKGSPFFWARATLPGNGTKGERWEVSTGVPRTGDRAAATRTAAVLFVAALARAGRGAAVPKTVTEQIDLFSLSSQFLLHDEETYRGHDGRRAGRLKTDMDYVLARWKRIEQITSGAWLAARAELHKSAGGPLGHRSIGHLANTLRHFLRWAQERGFVSTVPEIKSPMSKLQRAEQAPRRALDEAQRDRFLAALRGMGEHRAARIYAFMFYSGLRMGETAAITTRWIDSRRREITVPAEHSKSGEPEVIDLHPEVARAIRGELGTRKDEKPIFGHFDFHQANTPELQGGLAGRALLRAKLVTLKPDGTVDFRGLTPHHVTRHSAATIVAGKRGTTLEELMAFGRWKDAQTPSKYLHPTVKAGRRASRRL